MTYKAGDCVSYKVGQVDRSYEFVDAMVVDVDPRRKRIGIAIRDFVFDVAYRREGNMMVEDVTFVPVWEPKVVAITSISRNEKMDPAFAPLRKTFRRPLPF